MNATFKIDVAKWIFSKIPDNFNAKFKYFFLSVFTAFVAKGHFRGMATSFGWPGSFA